MIRGPKLLTVLLVSIPLLAAPAFAQEPASPSSHNLDAADGELRTFFLENAEVKDVMTMLRALVGAKHVAAHEGVNAILVRDTAEKVEMAAEIVRNQDRPRDEVAVAVELIELPTIPDVLPAADPYPSFVVARLVSKVLAHALANR